MGKASRSFARAVALATLLVLLVTPLGPLQSAAAAGPGAPPAAPGVTRYVQETTGEGLGCLTIKETVEAAPAALAEGWTITLSGPLGIEAQTGPGGLAQFVDLPSGTYTVTEVVSYTFKALTPTAVQVEVAPSLTGEDCPSVEFRSEQTPTNCLAGTVADEAGQPLPAWGIYAEPADGPGPTFATLTGEDGTFQIPNLAVGAWTVWEDVAPDWTALTPTRQITITPPAGEGCLSVSFQNRPSTLCLEGTLTDAIAGVGLPGAAVTATLQASGWISTTQTDAHGAFHIDGAGPGQYQLSVGRLAGWAPVGPASYIVTPTAEGGCSVLKFWARAIAGPPAPAANACRRQHTVERGDTLGDLGYAYGVSSSAIARLNHLADADRIYIGQTLCIP